MNNKRTSCLNENSLTYIIERCQGVFALQLASDVTDGDFILRMSGNHKLWLENYQTILEYTSEQILIANKKARIQISGSGLLVEYFNSIEMKITGNISHIGFFT